VHPRPGLAGQRAQLQLEHDLVGDQLPRVDVLLHGFGEALVLDQGLAAGESGLDAAALVGGDAGLEEERVDVQLPRQVLDRLGGRASFPQLDLADVLLREAVAGQLGLRQARVLPECAQALGDPL
jgi:hypothetical protein